MDKGDFHLLSFCEKKSSKKAHIELIHASQKNTQTKRRKNQ